MHGSSPHVVGLAAEAFHVVAVETPPHVSAVGQFCESFDRIADGDAVAYLDR